MKTQFVNVNYGQSFEYEGDHVVEQGSYLKFSPGYYTFNSVQINSINLNNGNGVYFCGDDIVQVNK